MITSSTASFEAFLTAIFSKIQHHAAVLINFISPIFASIFGQLQASIESTDFNSWNPKSCIWTFVVILRGIFLTEKRCQKNMR